MGKVSWSSPSFAIMKLNIAYLATGLQKTVEIEDEKKLQLFYDKRLSAEVEGEALGDEFKGYIFKITGGNDKQGFTMKQGVLADSRVRLLMKPGMSCYKARRSGERKRKSVRGCIVSHDISALALVVVKKGESDIPGLTDGNKPRRLGPKRASKIRKLFALSKEDDVRKFVIRRELPAKEGKKTKTKAPKIQRLITPVAIQRKRHIKSVKLAKAEKAKAEAAAYARMIAKRKEEAIKASRASKAASRISRASSGN